MTKGGATMDEKSLQQAIDLYDRFTHEGMDRRDFFALMTLIAGSAAGDQGHPGEEIASVHPLVSEAVIKLNCLLHRVPIHDQPPCCGCYPAAWISAIN